MDLDELKSKLHALEKLYGLLLRNYVDACHSSSDKLDDGARYMLKKLLDMESERVFKAHSEMVERKGREDLITGLIFPNREDPSVRGPASLAEKANQSNMIFTASAFENAKERCKICHRLRSKKSILSYCGEAQTQQAVNDLHPSGPIIQNEECNRRSKGYTNISLNNPSGSTGGLGDSGSAVSESSPSHSAAEASVDVKETDYFPKKEDFVSVEASAAVEKIRSHITALKLNSQSLLPPRKRAAQYGLSRISTGLMASVTGSDKPPMLMKGGEAMAETASIQAQKTITNRLTKPCLPTSTMTGQIENEQQMGEKSGQADKKQTTQKIVPRPAMRTNLNRFESIRNQIVPVDQFASSNYVANKSNWRSIPSAKLLSQMNKDQKTGDDHTSHNIHPTPIPSRRRHLKLESSRPSIMEPEPSQPSVSSLHDNLLDRHKIKILNNKNKIRRRKKPMDPGDTGSTDSANSARANKLSGDSSNEIDLISGSAETSKTSSSRSESDEVYSLPRRTRHLPSSSTSSGETEVYSSTSRSDTEIYSSTSNSGSGPATPISSNERSKYTSKARPGKSHNQEQSYSSDDSATSRKSGSVHTSKAQPGRKLDQEQSYLSEDSATSRKSGSVHTKTSRDMRKRGGFKKLKDKMAIIFHHHHHHHHHHLPQSVKNDPNNPSGSKINHGKSLWKRSKKVTDLEREKEIMGEDAVEKLRKSVVRGGGRKKHGHFFELVKGALRHRRHSKQSKSSKVSGKQSKSSKVSGKQSRIHHGSKKVPKKSHWWKLLKNQKGTKAHKSSF